MWVKLWNWIRGIKPQVANEPELPSVDAPRQVHLGIIVGHTKESQGAEYALGGTEYVFNTSLAQRIATKCKNTSVMPTIIFRDKIGVRGAYQKAIDLGCDCVIELHFNAFNKKVTGTETLTTSSLDDLAFAHTVQDALCKALGRNGKSRGVKVISRSDRGGLNVHSFPVGPNCLIEPFFGDVLPEAQLAQEKFNEMAEALVVAVSDWAKTRGLI